MKQSKRIYIAILLLTVVVWSCSPTRYVPKGKYLLEKNVVDVKNPKHVFKSEEVTSDQIAPYIKQRPNGRFLGMGLALGIYNMTDTSKHTKWHKLWAEKIGSAPVIFDSTLMEESNREIEIYLKSRGFLSASVSDSVMYSKQRKATVHYNINQGAPYRIAYINYNIEDPFINEILIHDTANSLLKVGDVYNRDLFQQERERITNNLKDMGFYAFSTSYINYDVDSSWNDNTVSLQLNLRRRVEEYKPNGDVEYANHSIYRISRIVLNTDYDVTASFSDNTQNYDSIEYNGIVILYKDQLMMKPDLLASAIRLSPNSLYDYSTVVRTSDNIRSLGYVTTVLFSPVKQDSSNITMVTIPTSNNTEVSTSEQQLECLIQCTPNKKQSITEELEISTTAAYSSIALTVGYQNRNLFRGAENFTFNVRGAYELVKAKGKANSYEVGVTTSLGVPRFWLPLNKDKIANIRQKQTKIQLNYSIQERPDYHRSIFGMAYGYGWMNKKGGRFLINPIDINVVNVPWVDDAFYDSITNPYLKNSYQSQMIMGLSASYYFNSQPKYQLPGFVLRTNFDANGNLVSLFNKLLPQGMSDDGQEVYRKFMGLRYSQYVRGSIEYSSRFNFNDYTQLAWRIFAGAGLPYGNSSSLPFERLFFAGGSNSMRGWQVRTLGPGGTQTPENSTYPNQLGDMRLEMNAEFRFNVWGGLSMAVFFDAGNIWMNSKARKNDEECFRFNTFAKQIALNTGAGIRWDFDFVLFRLDWGLKLHSPGMPEGQRWFKQMGIADTALHFAIGLPF